MSNILDVDVDGTLVVRCSYAERTIMKQLGAIWDKPRRRWLLLFTLQNIEFLIKNLRNVYYTEELEQRMKDEESRSKKLEGYRQKAKANTPVQYRCPGIKLALYNYQKLGVLYANETIPGFLLADEMGLGKAQPLDSKVATPTGWLTMGDISVGDKVIGRDGKSQSVVAVHPQGKKQIYRVTFSDGSFVRCCSDHLWMVNTPTRKNRGIVGKVLSVKEMISCGLSRKNGKNGDRWNWYIPMVEPVEFEARDESLDVLPPYVMGILLGDGCLRTSRIKFSTSDDFVVCRVESEMGRDWSVNKLKHGEFEYSISRHGESARNKAHDVIERAGLRGRYSYEKHIPKEYLIAPICDRLALLQGLMDSDGTVSVCERGNAAVYTTTSPCLRDGVVELCQSLGGIASVRSKNPTFTGVDGKKKKGRLAWDITLSLPSSVEPFSLPRKAELYPNKRSKYQPSRAIIEIEEDGIEEAQCITVSNEDNLYVTDQYVVTHNSVQALAAACNRKEMGLINSCLVVTPASLKWNWPLEIEKFTNERYVVIDGTPEERLCQWVRTDVLFHVVNYELLLEDLFGGKTLRVNDDDDAAAIQRKESLALKARVRAERLAEIRQRIWDMVVADEVHLIKNASSKRTRNVKAMKSRFRMGLTGTPIDGKLEDLHSIMEWLVPGLFENQTRFLQRHAVFDFYGRVEKYRNVKEVRDKIAPFFLRRLKKDVLPDLPDKTYQNRFVQMKAQEMRVYRELAKRGHAITEETEAITAIIRCKQYCDHPSLIGLDNPSSKMLEFLEVINEVVIGNRHKAIVFSQYSSMCELIIQQLEALGLRHLYIWGDTPKKERAKMQEKFNNDLSVDLMIGTDAMNYGLNFTGADYVINYDDAWSPSIMKQREDRAHRIGQKNAVTVVNFICRDTIEQRIRDVLYAKAAISAEALGDDMDEAVLKRLGPKDMAKLL